MAAADIPHTATLRDLDAFIAAFGAALAANELTTLVAKVEAKGPPVFLTDLPMLENRFQFARYLKSLTG
jgi:sulfopyruvate decarboxylase subunit beta